jgi:hypothetical protein
MIQQIFKRRIVVCAMATALTALSLIVAVRVRPVSAAGSFFIPGNLVVSRSVYGGKPNTVTVGSQLPPNCVAPNCVTALYDGTYPTVFNNAPIDGSFGITSKIFLDQITTAGALVNTLAVDDSHIVTSFSSKSEIALNLSLDGNFLTFMGYATKINAIDVSNSNTPLVVDPTNPVPESVYREVATVNANRDIQYKIRNGVWTLVIPSP